jgi:Fur family ferric uptake transcriptional regulator
MPQLTTDDILARCVAADIRMTEQRRVIIGVLARACDHPDADELHRRCTAIDGRISVSTLYRTLKVLADAGIIRQHDFREGRARFDQIGADNHHHLVDMAGRTVIDFQSDAMDLLQAEIARKFGFKLVDHRLELYCVPLDDKTSSDKPNLIDDSESRDDARNLAGSPVF